ncbi:hypothetical protein [Citrobacter sp.]|uniref:hypothetical protein n=1 Tax=Citrobacter sp. TaxID=1896336 RepID=UPI002FCAE6C8
MLKPHEFREFVNELRQTARQFHNYGCLREMIAEVVHKYIKVDFMGKKETAAVNKLIEVTQKKVKWSKIENIGSAMPDLVGINRLYSETIWIEAKQIESIPSRPDTKPLKGKFENGQQAWGRSWNSWGGKHAVFLRVGTGRYDYYLFSVSHGDLEEKTWEELIQDSMITKGLDNIIMFLEHWH